MEWSSGSSSICSVTECILKKVVQMIPVRHSGGPLGLTLTLTLTPGMVDLRNGGPPEWGAGTVQILEQLLSINQIK